MSARGRWMVFLNFINGRRCGRSNDHNLFPEDHTLFCLGFSGTNSIMPPKYFRAVRKQSLDCCRNSFRTNTRPPRLLSKLSPCLFNTYIYLLGRRPSNAYAENGQLGRRRFIRIIIIICTHTYTLTCLFDL